MAPSSSFTSRRHLLIGVLLIVTLSHLLAENRAWAHRGHPHLPRPTKSNHLPRPTAEPILEASAEDDELNIGGGDDAIGNDSTSGEENDDDCTDCAEKKRKAESHLTAEQIREMRIEDIKRQILRKLRLKARPNITMPRNLLPSPLSEGELSFKGASHQLTRDIDDYYGRTEHIIVFAEQNHHRCFTHRSHPSACLSFSLAANLPEGGEVTSAELWVFKERDRRDAHNQTFVVEDVPTENHSIVKKRHPIDDLETSVKAGWIKFDVKVAIKRWLHRPDAVHGLEVICRTCNREPHRNPISEQARHRPFLVLTTDPSKERHRSKRSTNCGSETTHCCRESLFVSFHDIGWDDWIIQPSGYTANYCRGSCLEDVAIPLSRTHHTTVMQRYVQNRNLSPTQRAHLTPCCTPTRMSAISLLYLDDDGRVYQKNLPNMVVDTCGCS